jgi:hypothetical protein
MGVKAARIAFIGSVDRQGRAQLEDTLQKITKAAKKPDTGVMMEMMSGSGLSGQDWKFAEVPVGLEFFKSVDVQLSVFGDFPQVNLVMVEGVLSEETLKTLESKTDDDLNSAIQNYRDNFWKFLKENKVIPSRAVDPAYEQNGCSIMHFALDSGIEPILGENPEKDFERVQDQIRKAGILRRYHANPIGLISLYQFDLLAQSNAVLTNSGYDFSGITILQLSNKPEMGNFSPLLSNYGRIVELLLIHQWMRNRIAQSTTWKDSVSSLSEEIRRLKGSTGMLDLMKPALPQIEQKGLFLADYASVMDECRFVDRFIKKEKRLSESAFWAELPVLKSPNFPSLQTGVMSELASNIEYLSGTVKDEFEVLNTQFDSLTDYVSTVTDLALATSNLNMAKSNSRLQFILVGLTIILIVLTAVLASKAL